MSKQQNVNFLLLLLAVFSLHLLAPNYVTGYRLAATFSFYLLLCGFILRKNTNWHWKLMSSGIFMDLGIVLLLQINRNAVQTAASFSLSWVAQLHIAASLIATILYLPTLFLGFQMVLRPQSRVKYLKLHKLIATGALSFRALGFCFMFAVTPSV